jgi:hypothetical protein
MYGSIAKWVAEVTDPARMAETLAAESVKRLCATKNSARGQCCGGTAGYDHRYTAANEISCKRRQPIIVTAAFWPST